MPSSRFDRHHLVVACGILLFAGACANEKRGVAFDTAAGDVVISDSLADALNLKIGHERLEQWQLADRSLKRVSSSTLFDRDVSGDWSDAAADRLVERIELDTPSKSAILSSGMSVKDYVRTSFEIGKAMSERDGSALALREAPRDSVVLINNVDEVRGPTATTRQERAGRDDDESDDDSDRDRGRGRSKHKKHKNKH